MHIENHPDVVASANQLTAQKTILRMRRRELQRGNPAAKQLAAEWCDTEQLVLCTEHDMLRCETARKVIEAVGPDSDLQHLVDTVLPIVSQRHSEATAKLESLRQQVQALS